jgi:hypothetical protein
MAVVVFIPPLGALMLIISIISLILSIVVRNNANARGLGIAFIVMGIIGNLLLLIPGIMAIRYKKKIPTQTAYYGSTANSLTCSKCGNMNKWDSSYCVNCGSSLR